MKLLVVSDTGVASFSLVVKGIVHVLSELGHEVEYKTWGEAPVQEAPKNVLVVGYPYYGSIAYCLRWLGKSKVVFYSATEGLPILDAYSRGLAENITFVTPSKYSFTMLKQSDLPNVAGVVPHGVDIDIESEPNYDKVLKQFFPEDKVLFICAENGIRKGFDKILVAMKLVKREVKNVRLIMHTSFKKVTMEMIRGHYDIDGIRNVLQLDPKDVWMTDMYGALTYSQLQSLYRLAKIYVCSSLSEGFCIPIIESKRWNKPTVALDSPPFNELIVNGETGLLVPKVGKTEWSLWPKEQPRVDFELKHFSVDDYADAIIKLLSDDDLYGKMADNIEKTKQQWNMHKTYPNLIQYF